MYDVYEKARDAKGYTDYKVSQLTGIAKTTFSDWKKGIYVPKVDKLMKIAEVLEIPLESLIKKSE